MVLLLFLLLLLVVVVVVVMVGGGAVLGVLVLHFCFCCFYISSATGGTTSAIAWPCYCWKCYVVTQCCNVVVVAVGTCVTFFAADLSVASSSGLYVTLHSALRLYKKFWGACLCGNLYWVVAVAPHPALQAWHATTPNGNICLPITSLDIARLV
jgi:hypothetical protein